MPRVSSIIPNIWEYLLSERRICCVRIFYHQSNRLQPTENQICIGLLTYFVIITTIFVNIMTIIVIFGAIENKIERQSEPFLPG